MTKYYLEYPKNLIKKAESFLLGVKEELKKGYSPSYSNIIIACQNAIELSAKAVFKTMNLDFPRDHQLLYERGKKEGEVRDVAKDLLQMEFSKSFVYKEEIPRLIFLTYFWSEFYTISKYGIDKLNIPPDKLFTKEDAELALSHAEECVRIATNLLDSRESEERK